MEFIINLIMQNQEIITSALVILATVVFYLITKHAPSIRQSTLISGLTEKAVQIIILIFQSTQYNHEKYNATLKNPVDLNAVKDKGEAKMKVAVRAMEEKLPKSTLSKVGDVFEFAKSAYTVLKPIFKGRKK